MNKLLFMLFYYLKESLNFYFRGYKIRKSSYKEELVASTIDPL